MSQAVPLLPPYVNLRTGGREPTHWRTIYKQGRVFLSPVEDMKSHRIRSKFSLRAALQSSIIPIHNKAESTSFQRQFDLFQEFKHCIHLSLSLKQPDSIEQNVFTKEAWLDFQDAVIREDTYHFGPKLVRERTIVSASTA